MAETTKFIDKDDFADYEEISSYITNAKIDKYILAAQEAYVLPILGNTLYDALQTAVAGSTETSAQIALVAKIKPFLVYKSFEKYTIHANIFPTNMGFRVLKEDNSDPAEQYRVNDIRKEADFMAKHYEKQLRNFLEDNKTDYDWTKAKATTFNPVPKISRVSKERKQRS